MANAPVRVVNSVVCGVNLGPLARAERQMVKDQRLVARSRSLGLGMVSAPFLPHLPRQPAACKIQFQVTKSHEKSQ